MFKKMRQAVVGRLQGWVRVRVDQQRERVEDRLAATTNAVLDRFGLDISVVNTDKRTGKPRDLPNVPVHPTTPSSETAASGVSTVAGGVAAAFGGVASTVGGLTTAVGGVGTTIGNVTGAVSEKVPGVGGLLGAVSDASNRVGSAASHAGKVASAVGGVGSLIGTSMGQRQTSRLPSSIPKSTRVIRRRPLARPKSSLDLLRSPGRRRPKSYADLAIRQTAGLKPHEILMKVATYQLGQMLLGVLQRSAQAQLDATTAAKRKLTERQIQLLSRLPMAILERILANVPQPALPPASEPAQEKTPQEAEPRVPKAPKVRPQTPGSFRY